MNQWITHHGNRLYHRNKIQVVYKLNFHGLWPSWFPWFNSCGLFLMNPVVWGKPRESSHESYGLSMARGRVAHSGSSVTFPWYIRDRRPWELCFLIKVAFINPTHESLESPWGFECSCVAVGSCMHVGNPMRAPKDPILSTEFHFGISEHLWHMHAHPHVVKFMEILMEIAAILN